jgi:hypothetical protein
LERLALLVLSDLKVPPALEERPGLLVVLRVRLGQLVRLERWVLRVPRASRVFRVTPGPRVLQGRKALPASKALLVQSDPPVRLGLQEQ